MSKPWISDASAALWERARHVTPAGVHSNVRAAMPPHPLFFDRAQGSHLWDVDGNEYVDLVLGQGPLLLGHNHPAVTEAVTSALSRGQLFGGQHAAEIELAELLRSVVPCAERVRFSSTGSEATHAAVRLARAATGRTRVVKFEGHYHGWLDELHVSVNPAKLNDIGETKALPEGEGQIVPGPEELTVLPWNDAQQLADTLQAQDVAAVIMEPVGINNAVIAPALGYLEAVRSACSRTGTLLIFDEVVTGFRFGVGGAQGVFGVTPDLATFGKAMAGGFPLSCIAGKAELFDAVGTGQVTHAGTFNANVATIAAALATLSVLVSVPELYVQMQVRGERLLGGLAAHAAAGLVVQGFPEAMWFGFGPGPARTVRDLRSFDVPRARRLVGELVRRHVYPTSRGTLFLSLVHTDDDIDRVLDAFDAALGAVT